MRAHQEGTLPFATQIKSDMTGPQFFSKLDASQGFYQLQFDEASTVLYKMATRYGRYSFKRMPYGISSAPEIFQKSINRIMEGLDGVRIFIDVILIWGFAKEERDRRLQSALERIKETNLKLNKSKCEIASNKLRSLETD